MSGLSRRTALTSGTASRIHSDEDCCVSQSASVTLCPCSWSHAARWTARVDFPTPPLEFAITIIIQLHLHDFFPAGKHYVKTDLFPSILLSCWQEYLPDRMTEGMK